MAAMPIDRHALLHTIFVAMDADKSDYIDAEEFKSIFSDIGEKDSDARLAEIDATRSRHGTEDGKLTAEEFCEFMLEYMADWADPVFQETIDKWTTRLAASYRKLLLRRVFAKMDTDRNGTVSLEEFRQLADDDVGAENSATFFNWIENAEGDGNGKLSPDEWVPYVHALEAGTSDEEFEAKVAEWLNVLAKKRRVTLLRQVYAKMDADGSGAVDLKEFAALNDGSDEGKVLEMIFAYLDGAGNSDGMLSCDEWVQGMRQMGETLSDEDFEKEVAQWVQLLTKNQRAIWRRVFGKGHAKRFVQLARAAGATHVLFVHQGATDNAAALEKQLTNQGTAQCMVSRDEWFGRLPVREVILASPAKCCQQTALNMAGRINAAGDEDQSVAPLLVIDALNPSGRCEELFGQRGYGPLRGYLDDDGGETCFGRFAEATCEVLCKEFRAKAKLPKEKATYIAVFGQAVYINALAHALACATGVGADLLEPILDINLREAEALNVPLYGGPPVQHLERPL